MGMKLFERIPPNKTVWSYPLYGNEISMVNLRLRIFSGVIPYMGMKYASLEQIIIFSGVISYMGMKSFLT